MSKWWCWDWNPELSVLFPFTKLALFVKGGGDQVQKSDSLLEDCVFVFIV